ncbi:prephenate dehydratase [Ktedonobacter racemifer DSM 44963]|uniref:Prephenate dehydratase n=1 Tax=Ktedonobacter racemifer DSM 44963 TaxID=485913 RepID=D6U369_KTERA|nr:prephenate dehydratase [Ktedonobacter racemifer DSM 44963]
MISVAFQGERGAFGDEAARAYFRQEGQQEASFQPHHSFADVFHAVSAGEVDYGIVPLENSQAGSINDVYDLLVQHDVYVIGEILYPVNHYLLCLPGQQLGAIKQVISHPQALAQCDVFLRELGVKTVATYNTAGSAKTIRDGQLQGVAAIASAAAAQLYGLEVLAEGIQTIKENYTRFIALSRKPTVRLPGPTKTMLAMAIMHQPGALSRCLGALAARQINLLKLSSRPARQLSWEYIFFLDLEGHRDDPAMCRALAELAGYTTACKVLGSFTQTATEQS